MEGARSERISIEKFIKRSWPWLAFGAVLIIGVCAFLFWFAVTGFARKTSQASASATSTQQETSTTTGDLIPRALDGVLVPVIESRLQPYAVTVENMVDARPLAGPASANLVYEFPVEGGITRYLLVFDATTTVEAIGPVRSARPYFVDMADGLNAVYAHVGGSPAALEQISNTPEFRDVNEFFNARFFWRSQKRVAPHNTFTRTDLMHEAATSKAWKEGHVRGWRYSDDEEIEATSTRKNVDGPKIAYGGSYSTSWAFDAERRSYVRSQAGIVQKDMDGTAVVAKNVVVMVTDGSVLDDVGRLQIRTTGKGKAIVYRDGKKQVVTWQRSAGEHLRFESIDGTDVMFGRGTTWIQVVIDPTMIQE